MGQLSELVTIQTGYARGKVEPDSGGHVRVIEPRHVDEAGNIQYDALTQASNIEPSEHHLIREDDILFEPRGVSNTASYVDRALTDTIASSQLYVLRSQGDIEPRFLAWYLNQERAQHYFATMGRGATVRSVNQKILGELPVPVPPMDRQRAIAHVAQLARREVVLTSRLQDKRDQLIQATLLEAAK